MRLRSLMGSFWVLGDFHTLKPERLTLSCLLVTRPGLGVCKGPTDGVLLGFLFFLLLSVIRLKPVILTFLPVSDFTCFNTVNVNKCKVKKISCYFILDLRLKWSSFSRLITKNNNKNIYIDCHLCNFSCTYSYTQLSLSQYEKKKIRALG